MKSSTLYLCGYKIASPQSWRQKFSETTGEEKNPPPNSTNRGSVFNGFILSKCISTDYALVIVPLNQEQDALAFNQNTMVHPEKNKAWTQTGPLTTPVRIITSSSDRWTGDQFQDLLLLTRWYTLQIVIFSPQQKKIFIVFLRLSLTK